MMFECGKRKAPQACSANKSGVRLKPLPLQELPQKLEVSPILLQPSLFIKKHRVEVNGNPQLEETLDTITTN